MHSRMSLGILQHMCNILTNERMLLEAAHGWQNNTFCLLQSQRCVRAC